MTGPHGDVVFFEASRAAQTRYGRAAAQTRYGRGAAPARPGIGEEFAGRDAEPEQALTSIERTFIRDCDGLYLATVSRTGWPYLQFRGGPPGLVQVTDDHTLRWTDLRGDCQLASIGNASSSDKVSLLFVDLARHTRLKVFGHATVLGAHQTRSTADEATGAGHRGIVERLITVRVVAYDWNCPSHIAPRYTPELQGVSDPRETSSTQNPTEGEDHEHQQIRR